MAATLRALEPSDHVVLLANALVWYARLALLWGDLEAAKDYAEKGRELAQRLELPAELAAVELALAEVYAHAGPLADCEAAADAARNFGAAAWYSGDRGRAPALALLFRARAHFRASGAAAALATLASGSEHATAPPAQRVAISTEAAAFGLIAGDERWRAFAAQAESELPGAQAGDALDALEIAAAAALLSKLRRLEPGPGDAASGLPQSVRAQYGALLARRADALFDERAAHAPSFETLLLQALDPASAKAALGRVAEPRGSTLTKRELEILQLLAPGLTNKEIAQRLSLSPRTVDTHVERVLSKLNATTRTRAVAAAIRTGLVPSP